MTPKTGELISVIIPFYNEEDYFDECINSVLNQTYQNIEIIIVNDGSDQIYLDVLEKIKLKYPEKIRVFNKKNEGVSSARNLGIEKSKGEYIAFLDSDDKWLPFKLEHQIKIIKEKNLDFIHGSYFLINENENFVGSFIAKNLNYDQLINSCDIGLSTVLVKSKLIKKHLFKNISTKEDYICWLNIVKDIDKLFGDQRFVMVYRKKTNSLSSNFMTKFVNAFKVYNTYENLSIIASIYRTFYLSISWLSKTYKITFKYPNTVDFYYTLDISNIKFKEPFILSALNMASLSNISLLYLIHKKIIFWTDGFCAKFMIKDFKKYPGRKIIQNIVIPDYIKNIYLCGNKSDLQIKYLEDKFQRRVIFLEAPMFKNLSDIKKFKTNIYDNSVVILNISTPKQEVLANNILNLNPHKKIFIFCLGGGIAMVTGEEKTVPESLEKLNLEWIWRLRTNTLFRLKRLLTTFLGFLFKLLTKYFFKINFKNLN